MSIYFDYNATTPLDSGVRDKIIPYFDQDWGNPSSVHAKGRKARAILDDFRDRLALLWKAKPSEVVFTSGGSEANNMAIFGSARHLRDKGRHLITSSIEHHAVLYCYEYLEKKEGFQVTYLPVDGSGIVNPDDLAAAIRPDSILCSIMSANNETGSIQPYAALGDICREKEVLFHCDGVQSLGKEPFNDIHQFHADLVTCCSHKFHGPKGSGALFIKSPLLPDPIVFGGGQENERRAGTENLPLVCGFVEAFESLVCSPVFQSVDLKPHIARFLELIDSMEGVAFRGSRDSRLCNTVSFSVEEADSIAMIAGLDMEGVCASSGSACSAGSVTPSHVLQAMGVGDAESSALVRLSLGRESSRAEVDHLITVLPSVIQRIRGW